MECFLVALFKKKGIKEGDRVAAYLHNMPETIIVMLASSSIGPIFSSASPDFGSDGVFLFLRRV